MRSKLVIRIWLRRLLGYLVVPMGFCIILFPLSSLMHQQTEKAQMADTAERLAASVNTFETYLREIRFTTNKLFNNEPYKLLAASSDEEPIGDYRTLYDASTLLQDLTYSASYAAYGYVTFARNHFIIDEQRTFDSYDRFYPGTLEYQNVPQETWETWLQGRETVYRPAQTVVLNRTSYPDTYFTISQPFITSGGQFRGAYHVLLREKALANLFLPTEKWRQEALFYLMADDGTMLARYHYEEEPLPLAPEDTGLGWYDGQKYLFVSREIASMGARVVIGLPDSLYGENLRAVDRAIWLYLAAGLAICLALSAVMTVADLRQLRPLLETLDDGQLTDSRLFHDLLRQTLRNHSQLTAELERARGELEHSRVEALLKTGAVGTEAEQKYMCGQMGLTEYNYLLLLPASKLPRPEADGQMREELRLMMVGEQVRQCYGKPQFVYNTTEGNLLVVLTLEQGSEAEQVDLCRHTEELHGALELEGPVILSGRFRSLEQLSTVYWQARNMAAYSDPTQKVCYLNGESLRRVTTTDITSLERLNEYLLAGCVQEAQELIKALFHVDDLSPQNFQQSFYSVRGVLLAAAQQVECEDVTFLCAYDGRQSAQRQVQNLCDCCFEICSHVDLLKRSHNEELQRKILAWLDEQYMRPDLNVAMTAEQFHISKKYVSQFLKDQTGKSYTEYVEELRLSHAMELLKATALGVTEIAESCGFSTPNTFYKAFRRRFGISPSSVRKGAPPK